MELLFSAWIFLLGFVLLDLSAWIGHRSKCLLRLVPTSSNILKLRTPTVVIGRTQDVFPMVAQGDMPFNFYICFCDVELESTMRYKLKKRYQYLLQLFFPKLTLF